MFPNTQAHRYFCSLPGRHLCAFVCLYNPLGTNDRAQMPVRAAGLCAQGLGGGGQGTSGLSLRKREIDLLNIPPRASPVPAPGKGTSFSSIARPSAAPPLSPSCPGHGALTTPARGLAGPPQGEALPPRRWCPTLPPSREAGRTHCARAARPLSLAGTGVSATIRRGRARLRSELGAGVRPLTGGFGNPKCTYPIARGTLSVGSFK